MEQQVAVEYVGLKDSETDHTYGTNIAWIGKGDVQLVPASKWAAMKKHADVWREVTSEEQAAATEEVPADIAYALSEEHSKALAAAHAAHDAEQQPKPEVAPSGKVADAVAKKLAKMDDDEVRAYVKAASGKTIHHAIKGENLRAKALEVLAED